MTDKAESNLRRWALRKNGDDLTVKDVVELVFAFDDDAVERHEENVSIMKAHQVEAAERDRRIGKLEEWQKDSMASWQAIAKEIHEPIHEQHMRDYHDAPVRRSDDDNHEDHTEERRTATLFESIERRTWVMWSIFLFIAIAVGNFLIMYVVERMFGR